MPTLEARTTVYRAPSAVFDALLDLRRYETYSDHLASVTREGDGGVGTEYRLRFEWWRLSYTVESRVTAVEAPSRLDFTVTRGIAANGSWHVEPAETNSPGWTDEPATRVRFVVEYDPSTVAGSTLDLPAWTSLTWVVDKAAPMVEREAERVVERVVADLEGAERDIELTVTVR